jgi:hypothetical protein
MRAMRTPHDHDLGLAHDLAVLQHRRAIGWLGGLAGTLALLGCGGGGGGDDAGTTATTSSSGSSGGSSSTGACSVIPEETAGPYPGDGSNSSNGSIANALALSGIAA